jgi:hypothetical protein
MFTEHSATFSPQQKGEAVMRRFILDLGAFVSVASFISALYLWMAVLQSSL